MEVRSAGRPRRSADDLAATRSALIEAAKRLFVAEGYESVSIRRLAGEIGVSHMSFYQYFPHKRALLRHIWEDIFEQVLDAAEEAIVRKRDPRAKLRAYMQAIVAYWLEHPDHYRVVYLYEDRKEDEEQDRYYVESSVALRRLAALDGIIRDGIESGHFRKVDPNLVRQTMIIQVQGLAQALITIPELDWKPAEQLTRFVLDTVLRGLGA